jgi:hypothetical protein
MDEKKKITNKIFKKSFILPGEDDPDINMDIDYLTEKRDWALERFNMRVKDLKSDEIIQNALTSLLRFNTQLRMMEEARIIHNSIKIEK